MRTENGFTLIEMLIVVAVIGILSAVAIPNYNAYVVRGKIAEATSALSDGRVKMEQFFQDNRTYAGGPAPAATTYFTYSTSSASFPAIAAPTSTTYTIIATGTGSMAGWNYTVNQANAKQTIGSPAGWGPAGAAITYAAAVNCWVTRKKGVC